MVVLSRCFELSEVGPVGYGSAGRFGWVDHHDDVCCRAEAVRMVVVEIVQVQAVAVIDEGLEIIRDGPAVGEVLVPRTECARAETTRGWATVFGSPNLLEREHRDSMLPSFDDVELGLPLYYAKKMRA